MLAYKPGDCKAALLHESWLVDPAAISFSQPNPSHRVVVVGKIQSRSIKYVCHFDLHKKVGHNKNIMNDHTFSQNVLSKDLEKANVPNTIQ